MASPAARLRRQAGHLKGVVLELPARAGHHDCSHAVPGAVVGRRRLVDDVVDHLLRVRKECEPGAIILARSWSCLRGRGTGDLYWPCVAVR